MFDHDYSVSEDLAQYAIFLVFSCGGEYWFWEDVDGDILGSETFHQAYVFEYSAAWEAAKFLE